MSYEACEHSTLELCGVQMKKGLREELEERRIEWLSAGIEAGREHLLPNV